MSASRQIRQLMSGREIFPFMCPQIFYLLIIRVPNFYLLRWFASNFSIYWWFASLVIRVPEFLFTDRSFASRSSIYWPFAYLISICWLMIRVPNYYLLCFASRFRFTDRSRLWFTIDDSRPQFPFTGWSFASRISIYCSIVRVPTFYLLVDGSRPEFLFKFTDPWFASRLSIYWSTVRVPNFYLLVDDSRPKFVFTGPWFASRISI